MPQRAVTSALALVVAGWVVLLGGAVPASADSSLAFTIADQRITESSGLAVDVARQRYWTINDSGAGGVAYALAQDGATIGTLRYRAHPVDVEAIALHDRRLYLADIGDNQASRRFVTVYWFDDPTPDDSIRAYRSYDFRYPDGPHDAETLLVSPSGRLYIVTKEVQGAIYAAPDKPTRVGTNELTKVGSAPAFVTDGTFLPDGRIALRTYVSVLLLEPNSYAVTADATLPLQPQGESLCSSLDGKALLVGSEGRRSSVLQVDLPSGRGGAPSGVPSPPGTASPTPTATPSTATDEPASTRSVGRQGTGLALGMAAVVAVVAGLVVGLARRG